MAIGLANGTSRRCLYKQALILKSLCRPINEQRRGVPLTTHLSDTRRVKFVEGQFSDVDAPLDISRTVHTSPVA